MSKKNISGLLDEHVHKGGCNKNYKTVKSAETLMIGDLFGSAYYDRPAGREERITITALSILLAERTQTPTAKINADIRRLLNIRRLDEMTMGGFETARAHLAARIPD